VYLSFLSVYRCRARDGSGQGSVTDRLNQRGWMDERRRFGSFSQMTIRLVLQWLACLLIEGWTTTSIESARMHEKDNGVFF